MASGCVDMVVELEVATTSTMRCDNCRVRNNRNYLFVNGGAAERLSGFTSESAISGITLSFPSQVIDYTLDNRTTVVFVPDTGVSPNLVTTWFSAGSGWTVRANNEGLTGSGECTSLYRAH